ncbi:hypothetical protein V6N11_071490 [Hibiscus sabdariffa]|uniref:RNase H type-1 domain-containing protein n=1 Tax=Hibiscus sabdariffa TaxID=183260 RepID=A0ABR2U0A0_9ROSI
MINSERSRRGLGPSNFFPRCHVAEEIVLHTLRDCVESKVAWLYLLTSEMRGVWSRPPFGWIFLNVDGAVSPSTSMGSAGGLVRDTDGRWLLGFNKFLGTTSPLCKELWAIYVGLQVAWDNGFEYVQVQSNCLEVVKLLLDPNRGCSSLSLVRAIDLYRRKCWVTEIIWIPCDANKHVDSLAKSIRSTHFVVSILEEPSDYLRPMLAENTFVSLC